MRSYAYYNGVFGKRKDIKVPLSDRALFFGDAIYDAAIGHSGKVFCEDEHIRRFLDNAERLNMRHTYSHAIISETLSEVISKSKLESYFLYFQLSRASESRVHSAKKCDSANLLITIEPFELADTSSTLSLITAEDLRYFYCDIKTVNLLPSVIAATKADHLGCDEAVFHRGNTVTECSRSNISIIKDGIVLTHPANNLILPGIARNHLLKACHELGIPFREVPFTLEELFCADEVLITSTTKLCKRATIIDGKAVGGKNSEMSSVICQYLEKEYLDFSK